MLNIKPGPLILILLLASVFTMFLIPTPCVGAEVKLNVEDHTLKNGMKVLILERHTSPTIGLTLVFKVGSVNEHPGITGLSHMLEHMLFKGSQVIGTRNYERERPLLDKIDNIMSKLEALRKKRTRKETTRPSYLDAEIKALETELTAVQEKHRKFIIPNELSQIYKRHGARGLNASTGRYRTNYYCSLPANKLELWAWLESERMIHPIFREFYQERDVVLEERRTRNEVSPGGILYEQFYALAYTAHPLHWPVIGWRSDIQTYNKKKLREYFQKYYAPNNAIAVIVGDVKADEVMKLMRKYFEPIPAQEPPPPITTIEPKQLGERRLRIEFDAEPRLLIGFHTVSVGHPDNYVLDVVDEILSGGRTSRLYKKLVLEKHLCLSIGTYNSSGKYPGLFIISAEPQHPHTLREVEKAIYEELEGLKTKTVAEKELARAKHRLKASFLRGLRSNSGMAWMLGYYESVYSWKYLKDLTERYQTVTAEDIMEAAKKYFRRENRTVAMLKTKGLKD